MHSPIVLCIPGRVMSAAARAPLVRGAAERPCGCPCLSLVGVGEVGDHGVDLGLLCGDDLLGEGLDLVVLAGVDDLGGHVDGAAVVADHVLLARSDMASFVDSLVAPLSVINALIVAVGMSRREEIEQTFNTLENIWEEYDVYEKPEDDTN